MAVVFLATTGIKPATRVTVAGAGVTRPGGHGSPGLLDPILSR